MAAKVNGSNKGININKDININEDINIDEGINVGVFKILPLRFPLDLPPASKEWESSETLLESLEYKTLLDDPSATDL